MAPKQGVKATQKTEQKGKGKTEGKLDAELLKARRLLGPDNFDKIFEALDKGRVDFSKLSHI